MKCSNCNKVVLGATLVSDTQIRCSYCRSLMSSPHSTNFKELAENERGICPYCGELNEPFKYIRRDGQFICRECGLSFELNITEARQEDLDVRFLRDYPKAVVEDAKWVDSVLLTGVTIAGTATVTKLIGVSEINLYNLKFSLQNIWIVFVVLTIAHFYAAWLLNRAIYCLWVNHSDDKCLSVFQEVTTTGWVFVRGLQPRTKIVKTIFGIRMYEMRLDDPSTWATHIFALLLIAAIVPFDFTNQRYFGDMTLLAVVITGINWIIGSVWLISLSELAIPHTESTFLANRKTRKAKNPIRIDLIPAMKGAPLTAISAVMTCAASLLAFVGVFALSGIYTYFNSIGYGGFYLKSVLALAGLILMPRILKRLSKIKKHGKLLFILSNILLGGLIIVGYWTWIT